MTILAPVLTPHGRLVIAEVGEGLAPEPAQASRLRSAFAKGAGHGLLCLGADEVGSRLPPELSYWREFAARYLAALCALPGISEDDGGVKPALPPPADEDLRQLAACAPPMTGAEYLTPAVLADLWRITDAAFDAERADARLSVQEFLKSRHPAWNLVGRVHFNLAENRKDDEAPFAFLAKRAFGAERAARPKEIAPHLPAKEWPAPPPVMMAVAAPAVVIRPHLTLPCVALFIRRLICKSSSKHRFLLDGLRRNRYIVIAEV
jgi:non-specific serine/threonine protein kinase